MRSSIRTAFSVNSDRKVPHRYTAAVRFWNGIIRNGVVAPGISVTDTMSIRQIAQLVRNLQKENPDLYAALRTGETLYRTGRMILREEIQLLLSVPKSKQEECVFLLLYTLGLRSGAIAGMKLMDIWDPGMARVSDTANIRESRNFGVCVFCPRFGLLCRTMSQPHTTNAVAICLVILDLPLQCLGSYVVIF